MSDFAQAHSWDSCQSGSSLGTAEERSHFSWFLVSSFTSTRKLSFIHEFSRLDKEGLYRWSQDLAASWARLGYKRLLVFVGSSVKSMHGKKFNWWCVRSRRLSNFNVLESKGLFSVTCRENWERERGLASLMWVSEHSELISATLITIIRS